MKKSYSLITILLLFSICIFGQTPEKLSYQAIIRNASDIIVANQNIGLQISILQGSPSGSAIYVETQNPSTNVNGLMTIEIGTGSVISGDFSTINWSTNSYFIKTEIDIAGGTNYAITATSQLLSVPYALHAKTAETLTGTVIETDPIYTNSQAANITATDITNLGNLSNVNTGDNATNSQYSGFAARLDALETLTATLFKPIISGSIAANGTIASGTGFTASLTSEGQYQISYSTLTGYSELRIIVNINGGTSGDNLMNASVSTTSAYVRMYDTPDMTYQSDPFTFTIEGR